MAATLKVSTSTTASGVQRYPSSDTGGGIAQEHIHAHLRSVLHHQDSKPRTGEHHGTGLGLSVTYGIIQEHAGKIRVESEPGDGTTFHLDFPLIRRKAVNV